MKKKCAFTICTRSYMGLAKALKNSFCRFNNEYDFYIVIADSDADFMSKENVLDSKIVMGLSDEQYYRMAFQYNVTEFCTSIKPYAMKWAFGQGYEIAVYLDPDILAYGEFKEVEGDYSVFLTPHMLDMTPNGFGRWKEPELTMCGVYNCGFAGLRNDEIGVSVADWWCEKLKDGAYADIERGMYTDQKWMDLLHCFVTSDRIKVIKHLGYDVAPWNFHERELVKADTKYGVRFRGKNGESEELVFLHFSGYHYKRLIIDNIIETNYVYDYDRDFKYKDFDGLVKEYREKLIEEKTTDYFGINYAYGFFENGDRVSDFNRRMFRRYIENGGKCGNPFKTEKGSFYEKLTQHKMITKNKGNADTVKQIGNIKGKENTLVKLFKLAYKILGADRYYLFICKIHDMTRIENSFFLMDK